MEKTPLSCGPSDSICFARGKLIISRLQRTLPCATAGGPALYKSAPPGGGWGESSPPPLFSPQPLAFPLLLLYETFARLRLADFLCSQSSGATDSSEEMASSDRTRLPPTKIIGKCYMTQDMIEDLERRCVLGVSMARPPQKARLK